jgi:hypothetical protein
MEVLVSNLRKTYPQFTFLAGDIARWSPRLRQITYKASDDLDATWSLLHELGHALLDHNSYESDMQLVQKETEAWEQAKNLAKTLRLTIDDNHIQDCLDTYRDWLHKRSSCPACGMHGLQHHKRLYGCLNCKTTWMVSNERFCRPYRLKKA